MSIQSERVKRWRRAHPDQARDAQAHKNARRRGYAPPATREADGPAYPADHCCQLCGVLAAPKLVVHPQGPPEGTLRRALHRDHDHTTGAHRGWLCYRCNNMVGNVEAVGVEDAVAYIQGRLPWQ